LLEEFELCFHRLDYRFHHEPKGEEQIAWQRALRFFWEMSRSILGSGWADMIDPSEMHWWS
jgi:hypothetical protein